jgi:catechol 2,3-dioxygenase-like lactoylglutathione lyase family enzyme
MRPHLSLIVSNVAESAEFYTRVFGIKPQKQTQGYAKFDLQAPRLNFSMHTAPGQPPSRVSHLGVEVESLDEVNAWEKRLNGHGIKTSREDNTDCCYARQDKIWFADPDGNAWEVFVVYEQLPLERKPEAGRACCQ